MRAWTAIIVIAGCGRIDFELVSASDAGAPRPRLELTTYIFDDGSRAPFGRYDSVRAEPCTIRSSKPLMKDGPWVCEPTAAPIRYTDAACTQPVGWFINFPDARYIESYATGELQLFEKGAAASGTYYDRFSTGCVGPFTDSTFELGPEVPLSELVTLDLEVAPGGRLQSRAYVTADGFREPTTPYDTSLSVPCGADAVPGGYACAPTEDVGYGNYFTDSACTQRVMLYPNGFTPRFANYQDPARCYSEADVVVAAGAAQATAPVWAYSSCMPYSFLQGSTIYALGSAVSLAPLARVVDATAGRRIAPIYFEGGGARFPVTSSFGPPLLDTALGAECLVGSISDGSLRCIPYALPLTPYFTDAGCSSPIELAMDVTYAACAPAPPKYLVTGTFNEPTALYLRGPIYIGPVYQDSGGCFQVQPNAPTLWYQAGAQVELSTLATATIAHE